MTELSKFIHPITITSKISGKSVTAQNNVFLAPLAGITDLPFRTLCKECGAGLVISEMISAKGVHYKSKGSVELSETNEGERPFGVQIFGAEPEIMAEAAAKFVELGRADFIDINMGCPVPKVTSNGEGSALMKNPKLAYEIVQAVANAAKVPVSVKMRRGYSSKDGESAPEVALAVAEAGASMITVHGRYRDEYYTGKAEILTVQRVKSAVTKFDIPVILSGDVVDRETALNAFKISGADGIMIGRGALGNPWIFREILENADHHLFDKEFVETMIRHMDLLIARKGEQAAIREMRKHIAWYIKGMRNANVIKQHAFAANTRSDVCDVISFICTVNSIVI